MASLQGCLPSHRLSSAEEHPPEGHGASVGPLLSGPIHSLSMRAVESFHAKSCIPPCWATPWLRQNTKQQHTSGKNAAGLLTCWL